jgi:hypothetical protein
MNGKIAKKLRKLATTARCGAVKAAFNAMCDLPLRQRIYAAARIIFRRRYA